MIRSHPNTDDATGGGGGGGGADTCGTDATYDDEDDGTNGAAVPDYLDGFFTIIETIPAC